MMIKIDLTLDIRILTTPLTTSKHGFNRATAPTKVSLEGLEQVQTGEVSQKRRWKRQSSYAGNVHFPFHYGYSGKI
jgi:hypothetical protein